MKQPDSQPVSQRARTATPWGCLIPFSLIFGCVGAGILWFAFLVPVKKVLGARNWPSVPCRIMSSKVSSVSDSDGTTYRPDISYSYSFNGQTYTADTYSFGQKMSSSGSFAQNRVNQFPAGAQSICYVNPAYPSEAVMDRGFSGEVFFGLMGLPFLLVPVVIIIVGIKSRGRGSVNNVAWRPKVVPVISTTPDGGMVLQHSGGTRMSRVLWVAFAALFWNGIVSIFVVQVIKGGFNAGNIFSTLFIIPFVLIGLALAGAVFWQIGSLFNPNVIVSIPRQSVRIGETMPFRWELKGGVTRLSQIKITLEGREEATFTRGTDTITDKSPFFFQILAEEAGQIPRSGEGMLSIPAGSMHSFEAPNNKIIWALVFEGPIRKWPDIREEWKITVEPQEFVGGTNAVELSTGGAS